MLNKITMSHVWVFDQDQALDFYVNKLGLVVREDMNLGFMRWLTVAVPGDRERAILLEVPGPPGMDEESAARVRELVSKGATGFTVGFSTDDARKLYAELKAKGVELTEEPVEHFYGIDFGLRDPFGNAMRIVQPKQVWGAPGEAELAEMAKGPSGGAR
ncbi:MAG TPA: VOC family protein [Chloroflexota bacterium]|nr:VOC family protein [Chloroflexota bacterium]